MRWKPDLQDYLVRQALADPMVWDWEGKPVHEWRSYIPEEIRDIWHTFSQRQKVAIMHMAESLASNELWE